MNMILVKNKVKKQHDASVNHCSNFTNLVRLLIREDICKKFGILKKYNIFVDVIKI